MSKGKKKPRKRKISKMWRGIRAPGPAVSPKRMRREYQDVLQNIEFVLVQAYRERADVDDRVCRDVLRAALKGRVPAEEPQRGICEALGAIRHERDDVPDDVWAAGLRTILDSVRLHSSYRPGETSYLGFVDPFIV